MSQVQANMALAIRASEKKLQVARLPGSDSSHNTASKSKTLPSKKTQVILAPVETSPLPIAIQAKVSSPAMVEVVHIPFDVKSGPRRFSLSTIETSHETAQDAYTVETEKRLKHVPNIWDYKGAMTFKWDSRSLVDGNMNGNAITDGWGGIYYVYKCIKPEAGLPVNEHFEPVKKVRPYGDVFVFRLKELSNSRGAEYGIMEHHFLENYSHNGVGKALVCGLAATKAR